MEYLDEAHSEVRKDLDKERFWSACFDEVGLVNSTSFPGTQSGARAGARAGEKVSSESSPPLGSFLKPRPMGVGHNWE